MAPRADEERPMLLRTERASDSANDGADADLVAALGAEVRTLRRMVAGSTAVALVALVAVALGASGFGGTSAGRRVDVGRNGKIETTTLYDSDRVIVPYGFKQCESTTMPPQIAPVRESGEFYFLSGILGYDVPCVSAKQNVTEQIVSAFYWADNTLKQLKTSWNEVLSVTSYHVDIHAHVDTFTAEREKYLSGRFPAWTSVGVKELFFPGEVFEMSLIARKPSCIGLECD